MAVSIKRSDAPQPRISVQEYLLWEARAESKSELYDGAILAMAGATPEHIRITTNLARRLGNQLDGSPCEPFDSDMRVFVEKCNSVFYPDLTVVCGEAQFLDTALATLCNPTLIVEVLSPSTEARDRGEKLACYQTLDSVQVYALVAQDRARVEAYSRQADGSWRHEVVEGLDAALELPSVGCALRLEEVYARVSFAV
jgi:Uma2 family endonuclease